MRIIYCEAARILFQFLSETAFAIKFSKSSSMTERKYEAGSAAMLADGFIFHRIESSSSSQSITYENNGGTGFLLMVAEIHPVIFRYL